MAPSPNGHRPLCMRREPVVHRQHVGVGEQQVTGLTHDLSMRQLETGGQRGRLPVWWPLVLWVGVILLVVVPWRSYQDHSHWARVQWIPFTTPPIKARDIIGNILLYVPLGYWAMRRLGARHVWRAVAFGFALSVATEFTQVYSHGRFPSLTDVTNNVCGAWFGTRLGRRTREK